MANGLAGADTHSLPVGLFRHPYLLDGVPPGDRSTTYATPAGGRDDAAGRAHTIEHIRATTIGASQLSSPSREAKSQTGATSNRLLWEGS